MKPPGVETNLKSLDVMGVVKGESARISCFIAILLDLGGLDSTEDWDVVARAVLADRDSASETASSTSLYKALSSNLTVAERFGRSFWDRIVGLSSIKTYSCRLTIGSSLSGPKSEDLVVPGGNLSKVKRGEILGNGYEMTC